MDNKVNKLQDSVNVTMHASTLANGTGSYAKVQRNTAYMGNIVERVKKSNNIMDTETLLYAAGLLRDAMFSLLAEGKAIDLLETGILYLKPLKGMESTEPGIEDVPKMTLAFTPSEKAIEAVKGVVVGADVTKVNVPVIKELYDIHSKSKGLSLTAGYTVRLSGKGLKVAGENTGVFFAPAQDDGSYNLDESDWICAANEDDLIDNTNPRLEFNLDSTVPTGNYRLIVKTAYGSGTRVNKTTRIGIMDGIVSVQTAA